ncbi:MAG: Rieske (2Fe-2S) protein [Hyphomicrobium sp.]
MTKPTSGGNHKRSELATEAHVNRRALLSSFALCGSAAALCCTPSTAKAGDAGEEGPVVKPGDHFARIAEGVVPVAIRLADLPPGAAIMDVLPLDPKTGEVRDKSRLNAVNLVRVKDVPSGSPLAETQGIMAYSAICTHKACKVNSWAPEQNRWRCFCHMSEFDVLANGAVVDGPATDPLPSIPLAIDAEGIITATAGFTSTPGSSG